MVYQPNYHLLFRYGSFTGLLFLAKEFIYQPKYINAGDFKAKTIIITGGNGEIAFNVALLAANDGAEVILACRDMNSCKKNRNRILDRTKNRKVYCWECDMASQESIREFADNIHKKNKKVDILINNAGVMHCPKSLTKEGIEMQLGTNYMGHFLLSHLLLDKLKESSPSRIINLLNYTYTNGNLNFDDFNSAEEYDKIKAYDQSQLAIALFTKEFARKLYGSGISVNAVYPGKIYTGITRHMRESAFRSFILSPYRYITLGTALQAAKAVSNAAISPKLDNSSGILMNKNQAEIIEYENKLEINRLWKTSEMWTHITE